MSGKPGRPRLDPRERLLSKVLVTQSGCWEWQGFIRPDGYALTSMGWRLDGTFRNTFAHRAVYEVLVGPIPDGLQLDHLCRVTRCVNPDHLEPVTPQENTHRGIGLTAKNAKATHCVNGHPFSEENTRINRGKRDGRRSCIACGNENAKKRMAKYREVHPEENRVRQRAYDAAYRARKRAARAQTHNPPPEAA